MARPFMGVNTSQTTDDSSKKNSERLTREDLMAMSRTPRPLEDKPPSTQPQETPLNITVNSAIQPRPRESLSPNTVSAVPRQPPSKQEKHSLNAAPRQRYRESAEWIGDSTEPDRPPQRRSVEPTPARRSDISKKQYSSPQDHWLVREAERRRLEEQSNKNRASGQRSQGQRVPYTGGPIKPHEDIGNRWRDNLVQNNSSSHPPRENMRSSAASQSFEQMRQKFADPAPNQRTSTTQFSKPRNQALQPRAAPRQSSAPSNQYHTRAESTPAQWQPQKTANSSYLGHGNPRVGEPQRLSPRPAPRSRASPQADHTSPEPTVAVSGKQQCSQCQQELGYGAAMVIESLNLHYHMQCFRCCVCRTQLGNGAHGADVRVRGWKLHCRNCYSNDEGISFMGRF